MFKARIAALLEAMGFRADAGETATFARQLEAIKAQTYDVKYVQLKARSFIPLDSSVPSGAESFTWRAYDWFGMAKILANYADDLPKVDIIAAEVTQSIKSLGASYGYTIQDMRASAMAGTQLDVKRATAVRRAIENAIDSLAAFGNSAAGLPGFLNNTNVPVMSGAPLTGGWTTATSQQILDDLNAIANQVVTQTKGTHAPDTMLFPINRYSLISTKPFNATDSRSVLKVFLENSPYIRNVDQWFSLDAANAGLNGPRVVAYERNPENMELVIPQEFEQFPPQARNLAFEVPCHARIGGVSVRYPLAMVYADGV